MVSKDNLSVTKRNGRGKESLNIEKIHGTQERRCCVIFTTWADEIEKQGKKVYIEKGDA